MASTMPPPNETHRLTITNQKEKTNERSTESGHDQLNYYLGFRKYAAYVPKWSIDQLRPIVIQELQLKTL